jgi:predicted Fe-Mo cluster-binding NifX family protein
MAITKTSNAKKIAIAQNEGVVSSHFGSCKSYAVFQIENGKTTRLMDLENFSHELEKLPICFAEEGIAIVLTGDINQRTLTSFQERQIVVIRGAFGNIDTVAAAYAAGTFASCDCHRKENHHIQQHTCDSGSCDCHGKENHHIQQHICDSGSCDCHGKENHHAHRHTDNE